MLLWARHLCHESVILHDWWLTPSIQYDVCGDQEYNNATTIAGEEEVRWRRAVVTAAVATTPHQHQYEVITANNHRNSNTTSNHLHKQTNNSVCDDHRAEQTPDWFPHKWQENIIWSHYEAG